MLAKTSSTFLKRQTGVEVAARVSAGATGTLVFSVPAFSLPSAPQRLGQRNAERKLTLGRHVQIVGCFGWCKRMRLLSLLSSFAFLPSFYMRDTPTDDGISCLVNFPPLVTLSSLLIAQSTAAAKVSLHIVPNELPTWPSMVMFSILRYLGCVSSDDMSMR